MNRCNRFASLKSWLWGLGALGLVACGNRLDTAKVEAAIKADIERQGRRLSIDSVLCPSDITRQAEAYFRCVGELSPEGSFTVNVIQQDNQGNVTWEVPNSKALLNLPKIEDSIQQGLSQAYGKRAQIDCGTSTYRVNQPGDRFECQVVGSLETDTSTIESVLVKVDSDGNLSWQELPSPGAVAAAAGVNPVAGRPAAATTQSSPQPSSPVKTTSVTGPTGRAINRPYIPGDSD
ncbi:DUF4333 domain-containing protein [Nodosilinea sp. LEGE 07088]|uniref:DUF4333 domain-containing protein n=1 Tax=Nodosilinea sp. LEGE 07088 TaxID=2777968 RepID=UPI00187E6F13|nr:DUF4333 domain-containing protein [Nodosilinea sp. LEGE 07088]MBE9135937.1 DUF4333 domain-containing protein [Nodosilinea sp. LEGE 07088]